MKCLFFNGKLNYLTDYPKPIRNKGEVLIKVSYSAVCNTDKEILKGYKEFNGILGHEFVGIVEEADNEGLIGKRVTGEINIGCGECSFCKRGLKNHCLNRKVLGIKDKDGAFAEYITLPEENISIIPETIKDTQAVFIEPLAAALQITEINHIKPSDKVAIIGNGKLGKMIAQVVSLTGCELSVIGRRKEKLKSFENIAKTFTWEDVEREPIYDVVIECTGNSQGIEEAQNIIKPRGTIILKSTYVGQATLNPTHWTVNEINIKGSRCGPIKAAIRLLEKNIINLNFLLGDIYELENYEKAFSSNNGKAIFKL